MLQPFAPAICFLRLLLSPSTPVAYRFHPQATARLTQRRPNSNSNNRKSPSPLLLASAPVPWTACASRMRRTRGNSAFIPDKETSSPGTLCQHIDRHEGRSRPLAINGRGSSRKVVMKVLSGGRGRGLRKNTEMAAADGFRLLSHRKHEKWEGRHKQISSQQLNTEGSTEGGMVNIFSFVTIKLKLKIHL